MRAASPALLAAVLFGISTPLAKLLLGDMSALWLAGLLYLGCGVGLGLLLLARLVRDRQAAVHMRVPPAELPWLLGAIVVGGMLGPVLLMSGLARTDGATASLLLNVEAVLTAVIAWVVFKENADRRVIMGMVLIVAGGILLSWEPGAGAWSPGALLVVAACLAWAIDNNMTRRVSTNDAMFLACIKGLVAGTCNTVLALASGTPVPAVGAIGGSLALGFIGYGLSITLFVLGLRDLGTARTGAYFSTAPLFGVLVSLLLWPQLPSLTLAVAAVLMAAGVWLHLRERHEHEHAHEPLEHTHAHRHDEHHRHQHDFPWDGREPHVHRHRHAVLVHTHPHYPDIHHRHDHPH